MTIITIGSSWVFAVMYLLLVHDDHQCEAKAAKHDTENGDILSGNGRDECHAITPVLDAEPYGHLAIP